MKVVTRYPSRVPSLDSKILLMNMDSGEVLSVMDGNWITAMRTGAVAAHAVMHFARNNWQTIGMIGLGNTARASLEVLSAVTDRPIEVKLLRYKNQAELFKGRFDNYTNLTFKIVDTIEDCIRGSDVVISCATYFEYDIAEDAWFKEGGLVIPVHTRGFTNCDLFFDKVFADDAGHVCDFKNYSRFRCFAEVSDVINGSADGRMNDQERILVYNIGIAIHDINFAAHIYEMISTNRELLEGIQEIDMHEPDEKFWV